MILVKIFYPSVSKKTKIRIISSRVGSDAQCIWTYTSIRARDHRRNNRKLRFLDALQNWPWKRISLEK